MARKRGPSASEELALVQVELLQDVKDLLRAVLGCTVCPVCFGAGQLKEAAARFYGASPEKQAAATLLDAMRPCKCRVDARNLLESMVEEEESADEDEDEDGD